METMKAIAKRKSTRAFDSEKQISKTELEDRDVLYGVPTVVLVSSSEPKFPNVQYANVGCIMENMLLAATDLGVDSIYLWGAVNVIAQMSELQRELGVPEGFRPISAAGLGYAAESSPYEKELEVTLAINYAP